MRTLILLFLAADMALTVRAGTFDVTLKAAEDSALSSSSRYKSARFSAEAARAAADASASLLSPRLGLEGNLKYLETIPAITLPAALGGPRPLGDNWNYSIGPSAYWTLDGGTMRAGREVARKTVSARSAEAENVRRQVLLKTRAAYFGLQFALERVYLIGENRSRRTSRTWARVKAGSRSRLDGMGPGLSNGAAPRPAARPRRTAGMLRDFSL